MQSDAFEEARKPQKDTDPWEVCNGCARKHTNDLCESWRDEVDKLLIFVSFMMQYKISEASFICQAGLFSGVVTAFAIESYQAVREDPAETTVLLLRTVILQLDNMTNPQPNIPIDLSPRLPPASSSDRRINTFWFLSLALSLSTVMAGILCLQWIREYGRNANVPHREDVALHHMHYEGMKKWHVFTILRALPLLLIAALLLFFAGFIEVLWEVDKVAAILVVIVVGIAFFFILMTTLLPTLQCLWICVFPGTDFSQCPYKSPQAWIFHKSVTLLSYFVHRLIRPQCKAGHSNSFSDLLKIQHWQDYDQFLRKHRDTFAKVKLRDVGRGIAGIGEMFVQHQRVVEAVCRCLRDLKPEVALDASLASLNPRRVASVHERIIANRFVSPMKKKEYVHDLIVAHTLEHFAEKMEQGHMSPALLQQRLDLFLKINEGGWLDQDLECPVNRNNVTLVSRGMCFILPIILPFLSKAIQISGKGCYFASVSCCERTLNVKRRTPMVHLKSFVRSSWRPLPRTRFHRWLSAP